MRAGAIGTTGVRIDGESVPAEHTTPEAPDLHRLLSRMVDAGVEAVAMEVSSHGLAQHRVGGIRFSCAVFTNLSQDHLDYHETLDEYFAAKAMLFTPAMSEQAAVNADSEYGLRLTNTGVPTTTYGVAAVADVRGTNVDVTAGGIAFDVAPAMHVDSKLRGRYNVENCLAAVAAARILGISDGAIAAGLESVAGVPGRLEPVDEGQDFAVLVDYAHTPDSVENVLNAARGLTGGRVIAVIGCGGDRDRTKRPKMGKAATSLATLTIITSDNPRSEDPLAIIAEIKPGAVEGGGPFEVEPDRRKAIHAALRAASNGDVVVIAGKGHETGQQFADQTIPFDDRVVAAEELRALRGNPA
jgi:UDP-N-acetylmuramoyl-L-alanyl-D-glutamate--2,6-diaminopimelate ligase